jgi:predicted aldo/keto reductase-like oxidoreductase
MARPIILVRSISRDFFEKQLKRLGFDFIDVFARKKHDRVH